MTETPESARERPSPQPAGVDTPAGHTDETMAPTRDAQAARLSLEDALDQHPDERGRELIREAAQLLEGEL